MKKFKCYGRVKTKALCTSSEEAVFDDSGQPTQAAAPSKINRPPDSRTSNIDLFTSLTEVKTVPKRVLQQRKIKVCKAKNKRKHPDPIISDVSKSLLLNNASHSKRSGNKKYRLHFQRKKPITNRERSTQHLAESDMSNSKVLKYKKYNTRFVRQAHARKCHRNKQYNDDNTFAREKEPRWSSIYKYPLNVEKCGKRNKCVYPAFPKEYNFDKSLRVTLTRLDKSLQVHLTRLDTSIKKNLTQFDKELQVNLTRLNLADYSYVHVPEKSFQCGMISSDVNFVQKSNKDKEINPSTPIKAHQSNLEDLQLQYSLADAHLKKLNILTSTPVTLHKTHGGITFPNISGISNKNNCSARVAFTSENSHSNLGSTDPAIFPNIIMPALSPSFLLTKRKANTNVSPISRTHAAFSKVEKSALSCMSSLRSCCSKNEIISSHTSESDMKITLSTLLEISKQDSVINFEDVFNWSEIAVRKIGEGSYGEVFMLTKKKLSTVIKVIPFSEGNGNPAFQTIESVFSEIKVSMCLSGLRSNGNNKTKNFNLLKSFKVVKGIYPSKLLVAWDVFSEVKSTYNYRPDFGINQTFAILELEYGGKDLATFVMRNASEAECIFKQIAIALAIGEEEHLFEHRDLHLGNILVQRNTSKKISYVLNGRPFFIQNEGLIVSIIDFTLSRVFDSGCVFYNDLAEDEVIFNQTGDFQFHVYKMTRDCLNNEWKKSLLFSNVLWLCYLCKKFLAYTYSRPTSKKHLKSMEYLNKVAATMLECRSALHVIKTFQIIDFVPKTSLRASQLSKTTKYFDRKSNSCVKI